MMVMHDRGDVDDDDEVTFIVSIIHVQDCVPVIDVGDRDK